MHIYNITLRYAHIRKCSSPAGFTLDWFQDKTVPRYNITLRYVHFRKCSSPASFEQLGPDCCLIHLFFLVNTKFKILCKYFWFSMTNIPLIQSDIQRHGFEQNLFSQLLWLIVLLIFIKTTLYSIADNVSTFSLKHFKCNINLVYTARTESS